jgi:membrane protein YdbS with pleckstrin-like domain
MSLKKVISWVVVAFVVFYVIKNPENSTWSAAPGRRSAARPPRSRTSSAPSSEVTPPSARRPSEVGEARTLYAGRRARKDVAKYLLPEEEVIIATRRHWASLALPAAKSLPALLLGGWLLTLDPDNQVSSTAGLLLLVAGLGYLGLHGAEWYMRHFIVSPRRMLLTSGVIVRTVTLLPRRRITDLTWQETLFGQLLGYGTFRIESAGQHQALSRVTFLPRADVLYRKISELLFPGDTGAGGDERGDEEPRPAPARRPPPGMGRHDTEPLPRREPPTV